MRQWGCQNHPSTGQRALEGRLTRALPYGTIHPSSLQAGERRPPRGESPEASPPTARRHNTRTTARGDRDSPLVIPSRTRGWHTANVAHSEGLHPAMRALQGPLNAPPGRSLIRP
jgi:hypothetical protein